MPTCPACGTEAETPLGCAACGAVHVLDGTPTPFEVFGVQPGYAVDAAELKSALRRIGRVVHPDYFGTDPELRARAERGSAELNGAFEVLSDDFLRADWLLGHLDGPGEEAERQMPQEFLMEVLEWNEMLEEARDAEAGSETESALDELESTLSERRGEAYSELRGALEPLPERGAPELVGVRRRLNAIRYLDRTLDELRALRLERSAAS